MNKVYRLIDRLPELPYYFLALIFLSVNEPDFSIHVFSTAFMFIIFGLIVGLFLKALIKSNRPRKYLDFPIICYDIPSIHTLLSIGAIFYFYFISPVIALIISPLGLLYMVSRIKLKFHSVFAVLIGAVIGGFIGIYFGLFFLKANLPLKIELIFFACFFVLPPTSLLFRYRYIRDIC